MEYVGYLYHKGFLKDDHHQCKHQCKETITVRSFPLVMMKIITDGEEEEVTCSAVPQCLDDGLTVVRLTSEFDEESDWNGSFTDGSVGKV